MIKKILLKYSVFMLIFSTIGCSTAANKYYSLFKKGDIIELGDKEVIFCVGCVERVEIGQEFKIYKWVVYKPHYGPYWRKDYIGVVKIREFTDTHHARAEVISGQLDKKCKIEL